MANNTEIMLRDLTNSPEFVQELLPAAERTALLYHLSYLCLANLPKLERVIRERALETQLLFCSSEALLLRCVTTSDDLVSSLLPMLKLAIQSNKTVLAVKSLEKARTWINEIVDKVKEIIQRYEQHTRNVASCTSDVITEKKETEVKKVETSTETKIKQEEVAEIQKHFQKNLKEIGEIEAKIQEKNKELNKHVSDVSIKTQALTSELSRLSSEKSDLRNKEWNLQVKLTDLQLKLANLKVQEGTIPDPVHLEDVKNCLSQILRILIQLQRFWESVSELLESLKKKTFVGENILDDGNMCEEMKVYFLESIDNAEKYWTTFGQGCLKAKSIFNLQTKDAYKFLESTPKIGSVEWKQEYETVMEKLNKISPDPFCDKETKIAEITE